MVDPEAELVAAAEAYSAVMTVIESRGGVKTNVAPADIGRRLRLTPKATELRAELRALNLEAKALLESELVTDDEMRALAARYRWVAGLLFASLIFVAPGPTM